MQRKLKADFVHFYVTKSYTHFPVINHIFKQFIEQLLRLFVADEQSDRSIIHIKLLVLFTLRKTLSSRNFTAF